MASPAGGPEPQGLLAVHQDRAASLADRAVEQTARLDALRLGIGNSEKVGDARNPVDDGRLSQIIAHRPPQEVEQFADGQFGEFCVEIYFHADGRGVGPREDHIYTLIQSSTPALAMPSMVPGLSPGCYVLTE